jgi:hypothetical protein
VIAGDVAGSCTAAVEALTISAVLRNKPVIFVPVNHDHYGHILQDNLLEWRDAARDAIVNLLSRDTVVIEGVRFLGCTLWTDHRLLGTPKFFMILAGQEMPDHTAIRDRQDAGPHAHISRFMAWHSAAEHRLDLAFLAEQLATSFDGPIVVVPAIVSITAKLQLQKMPGYSIHRFI